MADRKTAKDKATDRGGDLVVVNLRMPRDLLVALDAWMALLNEKRTGPEWTRTDVIRGALKRAITERGSKGREP